MDALDRDDSGEGRFGFGDWNGEPRFIVFFVPAPIALEFPDGSTFGLVREEEIDWLEGIPSAPTPEFAPEYPSPADDGRGFVSCKVWRFQEEMGIEVAEIEHAIRACARMLALPEPPPLDDVLEERLETEVPSMATVFELVTPMIPVETGGKLDKRKTVSDAFDRCLEALVELYRGYIVQSNDWRIREPTRRTVASVIPWTTRHPLLNQFDGMRLFLPNLADTSTRRRAGTMSMDEVEDVMKAVSRRRQGGEHGDPVLTASEHARRAQRSFYVDADYLGTLVWSYAWLETFLDGILMISAWEEGLAQQDVAKWFDTSFMRRIKGHVPSRLGGKWIPERSDSYFGAWSKGVGEVRHRIIHDQYRPTEDEALLALEVSEKLEGYIRDRLARVRRRFPKTALIVLGIPGLERRHLFDSHMRKVADESSHEASWLVSYASYAADVRASLRAVRAGNARETAASANDPREESEPGT